MHTPKSLGKIIKQHGVMGYENLGWGQDRTIHPPKPVAKKEGGKPVKPAKITAKRILK